MKLLIFRVQRFIANKSGSHHKIKFLRKHGMIIGADCHLETLSFGTEPYLITIGDHVAIAGGTTFITHDGGIRCFREEFPFDDVFGEIRIGNNVHIGLNCTILPNTEIGDNCIIGAGSVVRGKFKENSVIVGNPARVITSMSILKFFYKSNPGRLGTARMTDQEKKPYVLEHFSRSDVKNDNE